jgi:chromosome segregation ATPase
MPLSSEDMQDWLRLLERHPEWKAEVRRALLTDELLELPQTVARLAEAQARTEARLEELAEAQARTEARLEELAQAQARTEARLDALTLRVQELAEAQARTEARLDALTLRVQELAEAQARTEARLDALTLRVQELAEAQARTEARLDALALRVQELTEAQARTEAELRALADRTEHMDGRLTRLERDVAWLKGSDLERRFREHVAELVRQPFRRARWVPSAELDDLLEDAKEQGLLSSEEADDVVRLDALVRARRDGADVYLAVEVSSVADRRDVERAVRRAAILQRLGWPCTPAVAGHRLTAGAHELLSTSGGVWLRMPDGSEEA